MYVCCHHSWFPSHCYSLLHCQLLHCQPRKPPVHQTQSCGNHVDSTSDDTEQEPKTEGCRVRWRGLSSQKALSENNRLQLNSSRFLLLGPLHPPHIVPVWDGERVRLILRQPRQDQSQTRKPVDSTLVESVSMFVETEQKSTVQGC